MSIEFKIGMIGPRGAGKSSLLLAIYDEVSQRVVHNDLKFRTTNEETNRTMNRVQSQFRSSIDSAKHSGDDSFVVPQLAGSEQCDTYDFTLMIPSQSYDYAESVGQNVQFSVLDYPGNLLGTPDFEAKIAPFLNQCVTLLVPISADIAMTWYDTLGKRGDALSKNALAREKLQVGNVVRNIADWIKFKVENDLHAQIIFVPIKCEKYFNDNGGVLDQSQELVKAVSELYIADLETQLKKNFTTSSAIDKINHLINCKIFAVDTYGIAELRNVALTYNSKHEPDGLESSFRRRPQMGNDLKVKNAYELLIDIVVFQVHEIKNVLLASSENAENDITEYLKGRGWYDWIKDSIGSVGWMTSSLEKKRRELEELQKSIAPVSVALENLRKEFTRLPKRQLLGNIIKNN